MEKAIKIALEGGYGSENYHPQIGGGIVIERMKDGAITGRLSNSDILLDPLFWQALEKSQGWKDEEKCPTCEQKMPLKGTAWMCHGHRALDWIFEKKDINLFFKQLLK